MVGALPRGNRKLFLDGPWRALWRVRVFKITPIPITKFTARATAVAGVLVGLLIAPSIAAAGWLPAADLSAKGELGFSQEPQIAVGAPGDAVAVWPQLQGQYVIQASTKSAGGGWGPPVDLSHGQETGSPQVAMNSTGDAVAVWAQWGSQITIKAASRTPQGTWGPAESLSVPGQDSGYLDVAIDSAGRAVAVWTKLQNFPSDYVIEAATRSPDGQWGLPTKLSEPGNNAWGPKLAVDPSGRVIATWYRWNEDGDTIVQVTEREPGGAWSEPEDLSSAGARSYFPVVAASAGRAVVAWERDDEVVEAAIRGAGGTWEAPLEIAEPGSGEPTVGVDAEGNAIAGWSFDSVDGLIVEAATLPVGATWTEPVILSEPQLVEAAEPQVAVDPSGRAMAVWRAWNGTAPVVEAASGEVEGAWGDPATISPPGAWSRNAKVAMDSAGNAAAVWRAGTSLTMQAAIFDISSPVLSSVSVPSQVRAGRAVSFAALPFDAWSPINLVSWTFGDASTATGPSVAHSFQEAGQFHVAVTATDAAGHSTQASGVVNVTPALAKAARVVTVRNGRASLRLDCPGTAVCHGEAKLTSRVPGKRGGRRSRLIGDTVFAIPAGTRTSVTTKLKPKGLRLLAAAGRKRGLRARLTGDGVEPRTVILMRLAWKMNRRR
jgi:hypothetical protein